MRKVIPKPNTTDFSSVVFGFKSTYSVVIISPLILHALGNPLLTCYQKYQDLDASVAVAVPASAMHSLLM